MEAEGGRSGDGVHEAIVERVGCCAGYVYGSGGGEGCGDVGRH